ncbi:MAG: LamG domain-containing protein [Ardenticatenaceae bacterium]|nr:LamG domain-containing protein [Ardenticatenaceae bacterium]
MNTHRLKFLFLVLITVFSATWVFGPAFSFDVLPTSDTFTPQINDQVTSEQSDTVYDKSVLKSLADGIVAYYPLDGNAEDSSGNNFHSFVYGGTWTDGYRGQALSLDGDDFVETSLDMTSMWNVGDPIHFSVWIKTTQNYGMALAGQPGGGPDFACVVAGGRARVRLYGGVSVDSDVLVNDGEWHNVSWGTDGNATYFYVDGVNQSQSPTVGQFNREVAVMLGARMSPPIDFFQGSIDEVIIYNRALSKSEIWQLYRDHVVYFPLIFISEGCDHNYYLCDN